MDISNKATIFVKIKVRGKMNIEKLNDRTYRKVWYLHFKEGQAPAELKGEVDFFFGTKAAMYEVFDRKELGISLTSLQCRSGDIYQNDKIIMRKVPFVTKRTKRYNLKN